MALPDPKRAQLRLVGSVDVRLQRVLLEAARDAQRLLERFGRDTPTQAQMVRAFAALRPLISDLWGNTVPQEIANVLALAEQTATLGGDALDRYMLGKLDHPFQQRVMAEAFAARAENVAQAFKVRETTAKYELSPRVYKWEALSHGIVEQRIANGMALGKSWKEIAKDVRGLIDPNVRGGVSYAAKRLGRTEIANAYHASTVARYEGNPFVEGLRWSLSGSHPKADQCDVLAGRHSAGMPSGVYRTSETPSKPHPQCLCHLRPETLPDEEFHRAFVRGDYNDYLYNTYPGLSRG